MTAITAPVTGSWSPGTRILMTQEYEGKVWTQRPVTVLADDGANLVVYLAAGTHYLAPTVYAHSRRGSVRTEVLDELASGEWSLADMRWSGTNVVMLINSDPAAVWMMFDSKTGEFNHWYVDFQRPYKRQTAGFATMDLCLDVHVGELGRWEIKDPEEYEYAIGLGLIQPDETVQLSAQLTKVTTEIEGHLDPYNDDSVERVTRLVESLGLSVGLRDPLSAGSSLLDQG